MKQEWDEMGKMLKIIIYTILILIPFCMCLYKYEEQSLNDTELLMTFMVFRHGDRAPVELNIQYATDKDKVMKEVQKSGYGQLTDAGIRRGYKVGKFIRRRYDELLSSRYNSSEIYIRSTDSTRSKMTVLAAMAAVYPVEEGWCEDMEDCEDSNWTPVPYTTESGTHDFNLAVVNCPVYIKAFKDALRSPSSQMAKYNDILERWSKLTGVNLTEKPSMSFLVHDVYTSQKSMGIPLTPELENMFSEIQKVAGEAINVVFGNEEYISLGAGVLLKKFFDAADEIVAGKNVPKVHIYSAHDVNVYSFTVITKARPLLGVPKYGSLYALELRRVLSTGQYIVAPVYLNTPDKHEVWYLQVEGCGDVCELSKFHELVSKNQLNLNEWRNKCEWSEDYAFDLSPIA